MDNVNQPFYFVVRAIILLCVLCNHCCVYGASGEISCTFGNEKNYERAMQDVSNAIINQKARSGDFYCSNNIVCDGLYTNFILCIDETNPAFSKYLTEINYVKTHCDSTESICCNGTCTKQCRQNLCDTFINEYSELEYIPLAVFVVTFAWSYVSYAPKVVLPSFIRHTNFA